MADRNPQKTSYAAQQAPQGAQGGQPSMGGQEARTGQGNQGGMNSQNTWPNNPNGKGKYGEPIEQEKEDEVHDQDTGENPA
ncbi:MAG: hypothetical protein LCI00_19725 [Chloroflexi bacterium]|nr:hypothetical protein [Chloroflexota bacterium]MCC6891369.1 hypothetical protein [Anaerolineae bacterium]